MMEKKTSKQVMNDYDKYVMHSFVKSVQPIVVASAKGATVTDLDGRTYIEATKIRELALSKGVLLGHAGVKGNTIRIQPPLVITEEQLEKTVQVFDECLRETY